MSARLSAKRLCELFRLADVYNPHNFAGDGNVYIAYTPADHGRGGHGAHWQVIRPGSKTDPEGAWYNHGHRTFVVFGKSGATFAEKKRSALDEAQAWATEHFGIIEWAKTPYGSYMEAQFVRDRIAELLSRAGAPQETKEGKA